ncbi:MAG: hypothetical protein A2147_03725 [Chloroflexi bacterium RBG_16_57_8]|nr:MAG: hypothetical protein A2147_03725 [Chloroflexi bacterium RBG_16_57_8]
MDIIDRLIHGSIDMHVHHAPDPHIARCVDAFQAAAQAEAAGMRAIVLKSHDYPTAPLAAIIGQQLQKAAAIGSLCLDFAVGGLNLAAVEVSATLGAKVVWMPTFSAAYDMNKRGLGPGGISIVDERGRVLSVISDILKIIKRHDMVVASGHVSFGEIVALVDESRRLGISKVVITHALEPRFGATLSIEQQEQLATRGAYIEHTYLSTLPSGGGIGLKALVDAVKTVGAGRCILSTDLGQKENPPPAEGMRAAIASLLDCGLREDDITMMLKTNPSRLLGLS